MRTEKRITITQLRVSLQRAYIRHSNDGGWRKVGDEYGITGAMAFRIANSDYEPKDPHILSTLGLPAYAPAPVCPKCGKVHVTKRCTVKKPPERWSEYTVDQLRTALINREEW